MKPVSEGWDSYVEQALREDLGASGDLTTRAVVPEPARARGRIRSKDTGVLAGMELATRAFQHLDPECEVARLKIDGERLVPGDVVLEVAGRARALLAGERVALNFLQRLSGIATLTAAFVDRVRGTGCAVLETRKTTPGLRWLEKYAVRVGGGENHRFGLFDRILIKGNHFALSGESADLAGYRRVVARAVAFGHGTGPVAVEARDLVELEASIEGGADIVLLDNMGPAALREAVALARRVARALDRTVLLEASGGIALDNAAEIAATGVDRISVGALTHSFRSLDLSMSLEPAS
jgi:nicotinate-nucleotide pyrophosphorylase (carboxylating)